MGKVLSWEMVENMFFLDSECTGMGGMLPQKFTFFNCYLAVPQPSFRYSRGDNLTHPMLMTVFSAILKRSLEVLWQV